MKRPSNQYVTWWLFFDFVRRNLHAFASVLVLFIVLGVWFTNEPVSTRLIEGRFVRWTLKPSKGPPSPWVFVDLPDGRTTAVEAWDGWQPPKVGDVVHLHEIALRWFGRSYRLAPSP